MPININSLDSETVIRIIEEQIEAHNLEDLREFQNHSSAKVRGYIISFLEKFTFDLDVSDFLKIGLKDSDSSVRDEVLRLLEHLSYLIEYDAEDEDTECEDIRQKYVFYMKYYYPLLDIALNDSDKNIQSQAVNLLTRINDSVDIASIFKLFKDADKKRIQRIIEYIDNPKVEEKMKDYARNSLKDPDSGVRLASMEILGNSLHDFVLDPLEYTNDVNPEIRVKMCEMMSDISYLQELIRMTGDQDKRVRNAAKSSIRAVLDIHSY